MTKTDFLNRFESLGDNCEFGFFQRNHGLDPGGLLRWAIANPTALTKALEDRFANLYLFSELTPSADDMVYDNRFGLFMHSKMRSEAKEGKRLFTSEDAERREVHRTEFEKIAHLKGKLLSQLEGGEKIFVYKQNIGVSDTMAEGLVHQIRSYNPRNVLLLVGTEGASPGNVWQARPGLFKATIDRFAPYEHADDASYEMWFQICAGASALIDTLPERTAKAT